MTPETKFLKEVQKFLDSIGAYYVKQIGSMFSQSGIPDLLICYKGKFIALELKSEKGKPSPLQLRNIDLIKAAGGNARVLYPKDFESFKKEVIDNAT